MNNQTRCANRMAKRLRTADDHKTGMVDMLTDMLHLCDRDGIDFAAIERIARDHYMAEKGDDSEVKPIPNQIQRRLLSTLMMGSDHEERGIPGTVIDQGIVKKYVGVGWINLRTALQADYDAYPVVVD